MTRLIWKTRWKHRLCKVCSFLSGLEETGLRPAVKRARQNVNLAQCKPCSRLRISPGAFWFQVYLNLQLFLLVKIPFAVDKYFSQLKSFCRGLIIFIQVSTWRSSSHHGWRRWSVCGFRRRRRWRQTFQYSSKQCIWWTPGISSPFSLIMHACTSHQTDGASLVAEICGTKRQLPEKCEEDEEEGETKKLKKEEKLVMTGLSDVQIRERMGEVVGEPKDEDLGQV